MLLASNYVDPVEYGYLEINGVAIDYTYLLVIAASIISIICSIRVKTTFAKYSRIAILKGITGAQAAQAILEANGIYGVSIGRVSGDLTDHYAPSSKTLNLSDTTYGYASVGAVAVAAHECGHAIQDDIGYGPLVLRHTLIPIANIGSKIGIPLIMLGWVIGFAGLATAGIWIFSIAVALQIITLPVEFDASRRALENLQRLGLVSPAEKKGARKVLTAAAMTYVAAAASSVIYLLRFVMLNRRRRD